MNPVNAMQATASEQAIERLLNHGRRHALARILLLALFALMTLGGAVAVMMIIKAQGLSAIDSNWPALLLQAALLLTLVTLIRMQWRQIRGWQSRSRSVVEHLSWLDSELQHRRLSSGMLLLVATLAPLLLIPAAVTLQHRGLVLAPHLVALIGLCLLPSAVIAGVHGTRLWLTLPRQMKRLARLHDDLFQES